MSKAERMAHVNALAAKAKSDRSLIPELWGEVEHLTKAVCRRYCRSDGGDRLYDYDDLCQSAYFGFIKAVDIYDPERGAFSGILLFQVKSSCRKEIGRHGKRDALYDANSLDAPLSADSEHDITLSDTLTDPDAEDAFEGVNNQVYRTQLHAALEDCMGRIPVERAGLLRARYYDGATLNSIASEQGVSKERVRQKVETALDDMRRRENIEHLLPYWQKGIIDESVKYTGPSFFKNHWYSSVEWAAERIIAGREDRRRLLDKIGTLHL